MYYGKHTQLYEIDLSCEKCQSICLQSVEYDTSLIKILPIRLTCYALVGFHFIASHH